jgi:class 3 adenylate cyclase/tetratricopeptide (TPR) repeat protein
VAVRCRSCRQDNPAGARFCSACGTRLAAACAACGAELPEAARFCPACGRALDPMPMPPAAGRAPDAYTPRHLAERILTSRAALQGERKPVTVLFCDLVGSTALAERLGPDAMHLLLNRFFETALAEVHRYEGTVNQFLGDGFMALFGAPLAHEDHARRAALAAFGVARATQQPLVLDSGAHVTLTVRMGLNTGLVVVGAIGDNLRMDYTAVGDCTHVAARLQQSAAPGTIVASQATARLIDRHVALELLGALELRGLSGPVTAYRLIGAAAAAASAAGGGRPRSGFVGREREAATLRGLLAEVESGQGRLAGVVGEPGLGKSRLLLELRAEAGERVTWLEGRCLSYGSTIPYLPVAELLRATCGIGDAEAPERAADKIATTMRRLALDDDERIGYLLALLGLKVPEGSARTLSGDVLVARTVDTLRQVWLRSSRRRPLVLAVEDVHWIDPASEGVLARLGESLGGAALLLLATYRPGYRPPWMDRSYATQVSLAALRREDSRRIVHALRPQLADLPVTDVILDKAEGNPFFLEELVQALGDARAGSLPVPDSVQGVLAARIDRLPESAKQVLQTAAVLGREFPERLLRVLADAPDRLEDDLRELTRREFFEDRSAADEPVYAFKHALTQDVARASLVTAHRRALHRRAGDALVALHPDRVSDLAPVLAHHYLEAEAWTHAAHHARQAAEIAARGFANAEALVRYSQAVAAAERAGLPAAEHCALRRARADVHAVLGQFEPARADLEAALVLAEAESDAPAQGQVLTALGALWGGHRDYARGLTLSRRAVELLTPAGDPRALADARAQLGIMLGNLVRMTESRRELEAALALFAGLDDTWGQGRILEMLAMNTWLSGDLMGAVRHVHQALDKLRAVGDRRTEIVALVSLGAALTWARDFGTGRAHLEHALEIARTLEARSDEAFVRCTLADFGLVSGAYALAHREGLLALELARELGHREWTAFALRAVGRVLAECGDPTGAVARHQEQLEIARQLGGSSWIADALGNLGRDLFLGGNLPAARPCLEEAVETAGECVERVLVPLLTLAELALREGQPQEALAVVNRFRARCSEFRTLLVEARRLEAGAWAATGDIVEAEGVLREVIQHAEASQAPPIQWRATLDLAALLDRQGRSTEARGEAGRVLAALQAFAASLPEEPLGRTFAQSALMCRAAALAVSATTT